ncbi:SirB2 family protein [Spiribacter sp. 1M153]|uniref:SirB2 family protein n=1 Tax=Spiribacter roseus TaxID=1855875 RepID=UPI00349F888D
MLYIGLKHLHTTVATLTVLLFILRGGWMVAGSAMLQRKWVKILPHVIDTTLLITAFAVAWIGWRYPVVLHDWITAKVVALVVYIVLGIIALKRGRTATIRVTAFVAALVVYGYIVMVALYKTPLPI